MHMHAVSFRRYPQSIDVMQSRKSESVRQGEPTQRPAHLPRQPFAPAVTSEQQTSKTINTARDTTTKLSKIANSIAIAGE